MTNFFSQRMIGVGPITILKNNILIRIEVKYVGSCVNNKLQNDRKKNLKIGVQ